MTYSCEPSIIDKLHQLYSHMTTRFGHCTGISPSRFRLLQQLYHNDEISQAALQKELQIDSAAITRHLKQMDSEGIITRRANPTDNRITLVRLTDTGRSQISAYREEKTRFVAQMLQGFSLEEQDQLSSMIERMQDNLTHLKGDQ